MIVFSFSEAPVSGADFIRNPLGSAKMHFLKAVLLILPLPLPPPHLHPHSLRRLVGLFYLYCPSVIKVIFAALFLHQTHFTWASFLLISFIFMNIAATVEFCMNVDLSGSACVWLDGSELRKTCVSVQQEAEMCHLLHPLPILFVVFLMAASAMASALVDLML